MAHACQACADAEVHARAHAHAHARLYVQSQRTGFLLFHGVSSSAPVLGYEMKPWLYKLSAVFMTCLGDMAIAFEPATSSLTVFRPSGGCRLSATSVTLATRSAPQLRRRSTTRRAALWSNVEADGS